MKTRTQNLTSFGIFAILTGATFMCSCISSFAAESIVSVPPLQDEAYLWKPSAEDPRELKKPFCDGYGLYPLTLRRAENLFRNEHFEEAIPCFLQVLKDEHLGVRAAIVQKHCGYAYERVGNTEEALSHYTTGISLEPLTWGGANQKTRLLLKLGRYSEAKRIASNTLSLVLRNENLKNHASFYCEPCRLRAVSEVGLHDYPAAVQDLVSAAEKYAGDNGQDAELCINEANRLIDFYKLGAHVSITAGALPNYGRANILDLLKYFLTASNPFDIKILNSKTRAALDSGDWIKTDGGWDNDCGKSGRPLLQGLSQVGYETKKGANGKAGARVEISLMHAGSAIPKEEVLKELPLPSKFSSPILDWWTGSECHEVWKLPSGVLILSFAKSGLQVLQKIELRESALLHLGADHSFQFGQESMRHQNYRKAIAEYSSSINSGNKTPEIYLARAEAYSALGNYDDAISDASSAVSLGAPWYLRQRASIETKAKRYAEAIQDLQKQADQNEDEKTETLNRIAENYLKEAEFEQVLSCLEKALSLPEVDGEALFIKAQAEAGLKNLDGAKQDGQRASTELLKEARIVMRDRVEAWLKTLPAN